MEKIILIGAGSHVNSCIDIILDNKKYKIEYLIDKKTGKIDNYKVLQEKKILDYNLIGKNVHISIGQLKNGDQREKVFAFYKKKGCLFPVIISKHALICSKATISEGTIIGHKTIINRNVKIGKNCIINSGSIIEHDVIIEDNVHVAPGAIVLGGCYIKKNSFIGSSAVIKQNSLLKPKSIIPAMKYFR